MRSSACDLHTPCPTSFTIIRKASNVAPFGTLALVVVVVVVVPIAFGVPAVLVFIPPPMPLTPATLPCLVQFTTLMIRLCAVPSVPLDCPVELMVRVSDSALTSVDVFCLNARHCKSEQNRCEN